MESAFDMSRPVLYQTPKRHKKWLASRIVLWPAWEYRVVVPIQNQHKLNILQKAVLGLCRAGCLEPEQISGRLQIVPELASVVLAELSNMRYVDRAHTITREGIDVLDEVDAVTSESKRAAYIFIDPLTGDIWPRIVFAPDYASVESEGGKLFLQLGTAGKPTRRALHCESPAAHELAAISTPEVEEIIWASRQHQMAAGAFEAELGSEPSLRRQKAGIRAVWYIQDQPQPIWLASDVYVPDDPLDPAPWHASDPFGLGGNVMLERQIQRRLSVSPKLDNFIRKLRENAISKSADGHAELVRDMSKAAEIELESRMTVSIQSSPFRDVLYDMLLAWVAVVHYGMADRSSDVLNRAQKVLERVFALLWKSFRPSGIRGLKDRDKEYNAELLNEMAKSVGFTAPLPRTLTSVQRGKVEFAVKRGEQSLRPRMIAALISAVEYKDHPLRSAAREHPNLLVDIDRLAGQRDGTSHDTGRSTGITLDDVNSAKEVVFRTLELLIEVHSTETRA